MTCWMGCGVEQQVFTEGPMTVAGYEVRPLCPDCQKEYGRMFCGFCVNCRDLIAYGTDKQPVLRHCGKTEFDAERLKNPLVQAWNADPDATLNTFIDLSIYLDATARQEGIDLLLYLGESLTLVKRCMNHFVKGIPGVKVSGSLTTAQGGPDPRWVDYFNAKVSKGLALARKTKGSGPLKVGIADLIVSGDSFNRMGQFLANHPLPDVSQYQLVMFGQDAQQEKNRASIAAYSGQGRFAPAAFVPYDLFLKHGLDTAKMLLGRGSLKRTWDAWDPKVSGTDPYYAEMKKVVLHMLDPHGKT
jgi:hypothetical protein